MTAETSERARGQNAIVEVGPDVSTTASRTAAYIHSTHTHTLTYKTIRKTIILYSTVVAAAQRAC